MVNESPHLGTHGKKKFPVNLAEIFISRSTQIKKAKNEILIHQYDESHDVFFLASGEAEVSLISPNAKVYVFRNIEEGEIFGELSALDHQIRSVTVSAIKDCIVYKMSQKSFLEMNAQNPDFSNWLIQMLVGRIRDLSEQAFELTALNVPSRIVLELIRKSIRSGIVNDEAVIDFATSQDRFAMALGTHREAINREFKALADKNLISRNGKRILVHSFTNLEKLYEQMVGV